MYRVCFVCSGNICRSPIAEKVFARTVAKAGEEQRIEVSSAAVGPWHVGDRADPRAQQVLAAGGYDTDHRARQIALEWFDQLDLIVAMDSGHLVALRRIAPDARSREKVHLYGEFDPEHGGNVADPYYEDVAAFERVLGICERTSPELLEFILEQAT